MAGRDGAVVGASARTVRHPPGAWRSRRCAIRQPPIDSAARDDRAKSARDGVRVAARGRVEPGPRLVHSNRFRGTERRPRAGRSRHGARRGALRVRRHVARRRRLRRGPRARVLRPGDRRRPRRPRRVCRRCPFRVRRLLQRRLEPRAVAPAPLPVRPRVPAGVGPRHAGDLGGLPRGQPADRRGARPRARAPARLPRAGLSPVDGAGVPARAEPRRPDHALHAHAVCERELPATVAGGDARRPVARDARRRRARLPVAAVGRELPASACATRFPTCGSTCGASGSTSGTAPCLCGPIRCRSTRPCSRSVAKTPEVKAIRKEIGAWRGDAKLLLRVDRLELSKNIVRGFQAYEGFLRDDPSWQGKVKFLCLLPRSRSEIPEYQVYSERCLDAAEEINAKLGGDGMGPGGDPHRGELPAGGRGVRAVRRTAREPGVRRDEPRRDGGAARQPNARIADPVAQRRRVREPRAPRGGGEPVRHRGDGGGDRRGARRCPRTSGCGTPAG